MTRYGRPHPKISKAQRKAWGVQQRARKPMETHVLHDGVWLQTAEPRYPDRPNFVIVCDYGDWSGFRTLAQCLAQVPTSWPQRALGFFRIEER